MYKLKRWEDHSMELSCGRDYIVVNMYAKTQRARYMIHRWDREYLVYIARYYDLKEFTLIP